MVATTITDPFFKILLHSIIDSQNYNEYLQLKLFIDEQSGSDKDEVNVKFIFLFL